MPIKEPESMDELIYFTNRTIGKGTAVVWARKGLCPKCNKGTMGKPKDPKTGKVKIRAKEYMCPECSHTVEKEAYEETLFAEANFTCPHCGEQGEARIPFQRKKITVIDEKGKKTRIEVLRFPCKCGKTVDVSKKMK